MDLVTELIFPTVYTAIGAVIGGLSAYYIAKRNFSINRRDEGKAYVSLLSIYASAVAAQCGDVQEFLAGWNPKPDNLDRISVLREKGRLLDNEMSSFVKYWSKYKETIQHCRLKPVCKNNNQREQYAHIVERCESICFKISSINTCLDEMQKERKEMADHDGLSAESLLKYKNNLLQLLGLLKDECTALNIPVSKLGIQSL